MAYKQGTDRPRLYFAQRSYEYDSHDANKKFNGLTESDWKQRIREEWSVKNLKASHVVLIFHDKDTDENGVSKPLHVHAVIYFKDGVAQSAAVKRLGCSSDKNCTEVKDSVETYKYLLHITEKAIRDGKHIYGEECLEISTDGKKFNYHKEISKIEQEKREERDKKKLQKQVIDDILNGVYEDDEEFWSDKKFWNEIYTNPEKDEIYRLIGRSQAFAKAINHALEERSRHTARNRSEKRQQNKSTIGNVNVVSSYLLNLSEET